MHSATVGTGTMALLNLGSKDKLQHEMLQLSQAFGNLYYTKLAKPDIMKCWQEEELLKYEQRGQNPPSGLPLLFRNEVLVKVFAPQLESVKERCKVYHKNKYAEQSG